MHISCCKKLVWRKATKNSPLMRRDSERGQTTVHPITVAVTLSLTTRCHSWSSGYSPLLVLWSFVPSVSSGPLSHRSYLLSLSSNRLTKTKDWTPLSNCTNVILKCEWTWMLCLKKKKRRKKVSDNFSYRHPLPFPWSSSVWRQIQRGVSAVSPSLFDACRKKKIQIKHYEINTRTFGFFT